MNCPLKFLTARKILLFARFPVSIARDFVNTSSD